MEQEAARPAGYEGRDPGDEIIVDPFRAQGETEDISINVIIATFDVKEQRRDLEGPALQCTDCVHKCSACVERGELGEGATLIVVEEANISVDGRETGGDDPFKDLGHGLEKDNNAER